MSESADVLVIGGGIVGVSTAWFLAERGARVILLEKDEIASGCSAGNAGWIFPSHSIPIPGPGLLRSGLRMWLDAKSPLYVRPRVNPSFLRFVRRFLASCTEDAVRHAFRVRRELALASHALYEKLASLPEMDFGYEQRGLLVACETQQGLVEAAVELALLREHGGEGRMLDNEQLRELSPDLGPRLLGGVYYPSDAHLVPDRTVTSLARASQRRGVRLRTHCEVFDLEVSAGCVRSVHTTRGEFRCDQLVLAAGAWTPQIARHVGLRILLEPAKGYSVTVVRPPSFGAVPVMLAEAKVGITPMGERLRFAGTLELAGLDLRIRRKRVQAILAAVRRGFPNLGDLEPIETWRGLRPLTPDDLPLVGRSGGLSNCFLATGHGMSGMCQGPITGELIAQLVCGETPSMDLAPLDPMRFA